jgi:hypothetical protein
MTNKRKLELAKRIIDIGKKDLLKQITKIEKNDEIVNLFDWMIEEIGNEVLDNLDLAEMRIQN